MSERQRSICEQRLLKRMEDKHSIMFLTWDLGQREAREEAVEYMLTLFDELDLRPHEKPSNLPIPGPQGTPCSCHGVSHYHY